MKTCACCLGQFPGLDNHHLIPLEYGGKKDGRQIAICAGCHDTAHRIAEDEAVPIASVENPSMRTLVDLIRAAKKAHSEGLTEARDKRGVTGVALGEEGEAHVAQLKARWGLRSKSKVILQALAVCARNNV